MTNERSTLKLEGGDGVMAASTPLMVQAAVLDLCGLPTEAAEKLHEGIIHRTLSSPSLRKGTSLSYEKRLFTVKQYRQEMSKRAPDLRLVLPPHKTRAYQWRCPPPKHSFDSFPSGAEIQETGLRMLLETEVGHLSMPPQEDPGEKDGEATLTLLAFAGQHIPPYKNALLRAKLQVGGEVRGEWHTTSRTSSWPVWREVTNMRVALKAAESRILEVQIVSDDGVGQVVAEGYLHIPYKEGSIEFCRVKLDPGSEPAAGADPFVILGYVFETDDAELHTALQKEADAASQASNSASPGQRSPSNVGFSKEDAEATAEVPETPKEMSRVPPGLVLGCLSIAVRGVLVEHTMMHLGIIQLTVAVAPNEVVEKCTRRHALCDLGPQWEEEFAFMLNWPQHFNPDQFLNIGLKTDEGIVVLADAESELSKLLVAHFDEGASTSKLEGSCSIPLKMPSGKVEVLVEWGWRPWELICVDSLNAATSS